MYCWCPRYPSSHGLDRNSVKYTDNTTGVLVGNDIVILKSVLQCDCKWWYNFVKGNQHTDKCVATKAKIRKPKT